MSALAKACKPSATVVPHPTALQSPDAVRRLEESTGRNVVLVDGWPVLVCTTDAPKYLATGK